jgi:phospholipid/cholesterol/gamma-HCH transport system substrate-binding protein
MRSRWNLPILLVYALASLVVLGYLMVHVSGSLAVGSSYQVTADFTSASSLVPGDDVTISGVRVGRVASVQPVSGGARVGLQVAQQYAPFYRDARAMIKIKNVLNESYIEIFRGTSASGPMPRGGTIPSSRTLTPVELAQVLDVLNLTARDQLTSIINNLGESVSGQGQVLNAAAGSLTQTSVALDGIAHALASQQVSLGSLITSLSKVLATLAAWHTQLAALVGNWDAVMRALAAHEQQLQGLVVNENQVMGVLDQALARNSPALASAVSELPALVNSAGTYTANADVIFGRVSAQTKSIDQLFYELASVFSATDSQGNHYWRVYPVSGGLGSLSQPLIPAGSTTKGGS